MNIHNQFIDPSTCKQAISCNFTGPTSKNIIVSKDNILQIFELIERQEDYNEDSDDLNKKENLTDNANEAESFISGELNTQLQKKSYKISLISEYKLNGSITNITKFRSNENENIDYLIICTKIAKLSIIHWDRSKNSISTVSLHYYEPIMSNLCFEKFEDHEVTQRTDPGSLCSVLEIRGLFTFLPFYHDFMDNDAVEDDIEMAIEDAEIKNNDEGPEKKLRKVDSGNKTSSSKSSSSSTIEEAPKNKLRTKKLYNSSFILGSSSLHTDLKNVVDFGFLHSYREPTMAILYSPKTVTWAGNLSRGKDNMQVVVLSLDLESKRSTPIIELFDLPYDLEIVQPLPSPINGFLLIGCNEIIHVNSIGSARGIAVNSYYQKCSNFQIKDQSALELDLAGCAIEYIGGDQMLLITEEGKLYSVLFEKIGGSSNITEIKEIDSKNYEGITINQPTSMTGFPDLNCLFLTCQGSDSLLLGWESEESDVGSSMGQATETKNSRKKEDNKKETDEAPEDMDDDSWLYRDDDDDETNQSAESGTSTTVLLSSKFIKYDSLINYGPLSHFTLGVVSTSPKILGLPNPNYNEKCIIGTSGVGKSSGISVFHQTIQPKVKSTLRFSNVDKIWTLENLSQESHYLITTDYTNSKTQVFIISKNYRDYTTRDFDNKFTTVTIAIMPNFAKTENKIIQVTPHSVILFDFLFRRIMSLDYKDEIISAQIHDKYVMVTIETGEVVILEYVETKKDSKLVTIKLPRVLTDLIFTGGWITDSSVLNHVNIGNEILTRNDDNNEIENPNKYTVFLLATADNRILVFDKKHNQKVFEFMNVDNLPERITLDLMDLNTEGYPDPMIKQIMFTTIGDQYVTKEYLVILTIGGELFMYEMYFDPIANIYRFTKINEVAQIPITGAPDNAYPFGTTIERNMIKLKNWQGYDSVVITGVTSYCIFKNHVSMPRVFPFTTSSIRAFGEFHVSGKCEHGVISIDGAKAARICEVDLDMDYTGRAPIKFIPVGQTVTAVVFHKSSNTYLVSTFEEVPFNYLDEEGNEVAGTEKDMEKALTYKGYIKLISPINWSVIDVFELEETDIATSLSILKLNVVDSASGTRGLSKDFIGVGTGSHRTEDASTTGSWKIFDIISVVPEVDRPEANHKLKLVTSETSKGPAISICDVSGRFSVVQGQRLFVRQLEGDDTVSPVAFTDTALYSKEVKSFENLMLIADSYSSVSLHGFDAEPYRMLKLGNDSLEVNVSAADFIVHDSNLFILIADESGILHLLHYDPEDPNSLQGLKLLRRAVFRNNKHTTHMMSISRQDSLFSLGKTIFQGKSGGVDSVGYEVIGSTDDGALYRVTPISENIYRRLYSVQQQIYDKETHYCGLNPRMNTIGDMSTIMPVISRPILDFDTMRKFINLNESRKRNIALKTGRNSYPEIYRDFIAYA